MKKQLFVTILTALAVALPLGAVPAKHIKKSIQQPDGTTVQVTLEGDEHAHWYTTSDGTPVRIGENGTLTPLTTWEMAALRSRQARSSAQYAPGHRKVSSGTSKYPKGDQRVLVILAQYPDKKFSEENPKETFTQHLNAENSSTSLGYGSARDYFIAQSGGIFTPYFDVYGPYTVNHNMAYYGGNENGGDKAAGELIAEALKLANNDVNYKHYDTDGDGVVDFCYVIYAGYGEAQGGGDDTIWPHKWYLSAATGSALKLDGVQINEYACSNELNGNSGTQIDGIGTICHEFSHCLGLPDFYDTEGGQFGMFTWSIMDYGCYNENGYTPSGYTAYEKDFMGWTEIETLDNEQNVTLTPLADGGKAYRIENSENTNEYYVVENIQQRGWNRAAGGHGMLVTHVDYKATAWGSNSVNSSSPQRMTIVAADNQWSRSYSSAAGDPYPGKSGNTELSDYSTPSATSNSGSGFSKPLTDIAEAEDGTITFSFMKGCGNVTTAKEATNINAYSFQANWAKRIGTEDYTLEVFHITGDIPTNKGEWNIALLNQQGELIQTHHSNSVRQVITGLEAGNLYCYRVRCLKNGLLSSFSNLIYVRTTDESTGLEAPVLDNVVTINDSTFNVSWNSVADADSYILEYDQIPPSGDDAVGDGTQMVHEDFTGIMIKYGEVTRVLDLYTEQPDWRGDEVYADNNCVRLGSEDERGYIVTPYLPVTSDYVTIEFSVAKYNSDDTKPIIHICLGTDADSKYYVAQLGAYVTSTDYSNYYCVLGPLNTSSYIAFISNSVADSGDHPQVLLDNVRLYWGDLSDQYGAPAADRVLFRDNIPASERIICREDATGSDDDSAVSHEEDGRPELIATSTKQYITLDTTNYTFEDCEAGTYTFRVRAVKGNTYSPFSEQIAYEAGVQSFELDGINYDIISKDHKTVTVTARRDGKHYEGDVVIPSSITYEGEQYSVTELADSVFRGCTELRSAIVPGSVAFAGCKIFKGCRHLAYVDWQGTAAIDETDFIGTSTNTLVYVNGDVVVESPDVIVIRDGIAEDTITVYAAGLSFLVPRAFTARHIRYVKDFSQETIVGTSSGWETIVLPFDVQSVTNEKEELMTPFGANGSQKHFWLGQFNGDSFDYATSLKANIPYVIAFPNSEDYAESQCVNGSVTFGADNATVCATTDVPSVQGKEFNFVPVYEKVYKAGNRYMLNTYDHGIDNTPAGSVFTPDRMSLRTFGAYMESRKGGSAAPLRMPIRFNMPIAEETLGSTTHDVFGIDGRLVRTAAEAAVSGQTDGLPMGIYIIDGKKFIVR